MQTSRVVRSFTVATVLAFVLACSSDDGVAGPTVVTVSGSVRDYFSQATLDSFDLSVDDHPSADASISPNGQYDVDLSVSNGDPVTIVATRLGYRPTRNPAFTAHASSVVASLAAVSEVDVARQYVAVAATPTPGTGVVIAELVDETGDPREGIPVADIRLLDAQIPVGVGPFVFGSTGDIEPQSILDEATAFDGQSRVAFLDVPAGEYALMIGTDTGAVLVGSAEVDSEGVTLVSR